MSSGTVMGRVPGQWNRIGSALVKTYKDFDRHNFLDYAAALSFYFLLSLFPLLIFLASLFAYVPIPNLFEQTLDIMGRIVPSDAMGVVRSVLRDVLHTNPRLLSFSIMWAVFAASGGFNALINILNLAYDVREGRSYLKRRFLAFGLTLLTGLMVLLLLVATVLGPEFGIWLDRHIFVRRLFGGTWPYFRWGLIGAFTVLSVEAIYFLAPNVKQRFKEQTPGAMIAVSSWILVSWGLGWYVGHFAHYNQTFGALGAVVGLMMWFYISALSLMLGAEVNAELLRSEDASVSEKKPVTPPVEFQQSRPPRRIA